MAELLLVRSGNADSRVAERFEMSCDDLKRCIGSRRLHYLGAELPPIGETSRVSQFAEPDHVVVSVAGAETGRLRVDEPGFYVVEDLFPSAVVETRAAS